MNSLFGFQFSCFFFTLIFFYYFFFALANWNRLELFTNFCFSFFVHRTFSSTRTIYFTRFRRYFSLKLFRLSLPSHLIQIFQIFGIFRCFSRTLFSVAMWNLLPSIDHEICKMETREIDVSLCYQSRRSWNAVHCSFIRVHTVNDELQLCVRSVIVHLFYIFLCFVVQLLLILFGLFSFKMSNRSFNLNYKIYARNKTKRNEMKKFVCVQKHTNTIQIHNSLCSNKKNVHRNTRKFRLVRRIASKHITTTFTSWCECINDVVVVVAAAVITISIIC